jgi:hypothetical protein
MSDCLSQYYRYPDEYVRFLRKEPLSDIDGYFRFGESTVYGRYCGGVPSASPAENLYDASLDTTAVGGTVSLPFDLCEVAENLRCETYAASGNRRDNHLQSVQSRMYYFVRPLLPIGVRKHLQKIHLKGGQELPFPRWPVDRSVDTLFEHVLLLSMRAQDLDRIPFVWFWPDGASACAILTHDVEAPQGRDACATLMDIDDRHGMKSSFQIVPESRYEVTSGYLQSIRKRGFEICVHDLNHDGHLYRDRRQFLERAARINRYAREWGAEGFRAGVLYRRQDWFDALEFSYDMSVPNVAHLDPQRGGCCTIMPYFVGNILELPVTTTQDYTLFHILNDYSINLWRKQIDLIMQKHGLISFIVHPDYIIAAREQKVYEALLSHLEDLRREKGVWITTPGEVNRWWRQRAQIKLVEDHDGWRVDGPCSERARIAYASAENGRISYTIENSACVV